MRASALRVLALLVLGAGEVAQAAAITQVTYGPTNSVDPAINDNGEIAYQVGGVGIVSSVTGFVSYPAGLRRGVDINNSGEIVWTAPVNGVYQVFSNQRGQITHCVIHHCSHAAINNAGEIVYFEADTGIVSTSSGLVAQVGGSTFDLDINDLGEVVWRDQINGLYQIFSSQRGQVTFLTNANAATPSITNGGEIIFGRATGTDGTPAAIVSSVTGVLYQLGSAQESFGFSLSANNVGDVVWSTSDAYGINQVFRLTTVPIPASVYLFGSALGLMGWMRRKVSG